MEGLSNSTNGGNTKFLGVMNGNFTLRADESTPNAVKRINKNGKEVWELLYNKLEGKITNVSIEEGEYGKELEVTVLAGSTKFALQMPASGGYAFGLLSRLPNVDFNQSIVFRPYSIYDKEKDRNKNYLVLYQSGKGYNKDSVPSAFTKENPNGLPELEEITVKGKKQWDDTKRVLFFEQMIHSKDGLQAMLAAMYTEGSQPDQFLEDVTEPMGEGIEAEGDYSDMELHESIGKPTIDWSKKSAEAAQAENIFAKKNAESKHPNADAAIAKATVEGAKATASKKAASKKATTK